MVGGLEVSTLEIVILGYIVNIVVLFMYTLYGFIRVLLEGPDKIKNLKDKRTKKQVGSFWLPYAGVLEALMLFYAEYKFRKTSKSFIDFMNSRMED